MNNEDILKQAIAKAVKNGWESRQQLMDKMFEWQGDWIKLLFEYELTNSIIFNKDFAKALWGEADFTKYTGRDYGFDPFKQKKVLRWCVNNCENIDVIQMWQYHLQQLVLCEDPIQYLKQFI